MKITKRQLVKLIKEQMNLFEEESDSEATKMAKERGLKSVGFGKWAAPNGKVIAYTKDGKLVWTKEYLDDNKKQGQAQRKWDKEYMKKHPSKGHKVFPRSDHKVKNSDLKGIFSSNS